MKKLLLILLCLPLFFTSCSKKSSNQKIYKGYITNPDGDDIMDFERVDVVMLSMLVNPYENYYDEYHFYDVFKNRFGKTQIQIENGVPLFKLLINKQIFNHLQQYDYNSNNLFSDPIGKKLEECININGFKNAKVNAIYNNQIDDGLGLGVHNPYGLTKDLIQRNFNKGPNTANVICDCSEITQQNLNFTAYYENSSSSKRNDSKREKRSTKRSFSLKYVLIFIVVGFGLKFIQSKL